MKWRLSVLAVPALSFAVLANTATADSPYTNSFERSPESYWGLEGNAGFDRDGQLAYSGFVNAWARGSEGWHGIYQKQPFYPTGNFCGLSAYIAASSNVGTVRISIYDQITGIFFVQSEFVPYTDGQYHLYRTMNFPITKENDRRPMIVRIGLEGNGQDAWIRVDSVDTCASSDWPQRATNRALGEGFKTP